MGYLKTAILTGATGYLGSKLISKLLNSNFNVCIIKRGNSNLAKIEPYLNSIKVYNNDATSIETAFNENKVDFVIHTATLYGRKGETFLEIKNSNLDFPILILNCAIKHQVKYFINTGTSLPVYANVYALCKNQFSQYLEFFSNSINSINIQLEHFYGPGDDASKFITSMIDKMLKGEQQIQLTTGTQLRDFVYIEDVLNAYITLINKLDNFNGYNNIPIGSGQVISIRNVVELIKKYSKSKSKLNFGVIPMRENELMLSNADISKLINLGWSPQFDLHEGLKLTINDMVI